jgi:hypothetical protein
MCWDVAAVGTQGICLQSWRGKFLENVDLADREVGGRSALILILVCEDGKCLELIHVNFQ